MVGCPADLQATIRSLIKENFMTKRALHIEQVIKLFALILYATSSLAQASAPSQALENAVIHRLMQAPRLGTQTRDASPTAASSALERESKDLQGHSVVEGSFLFQ